MAKPYILFSILFTLVLLLVASRVDGYKNYTVGDSLGWFDALENPKVNYQKWADDKDFSLGDFLIFNTDNNHSVIQTYNFTTYELCDSNNALDNDTFQWAAAEPSATATQSVSIAVPLVKTGTQYFFSGNYDGEQCQNGQHFKINVTYGEGLPPSLRFDDSPAPVSPESGDDQPMPDLVVPSNFNAPKDTSDDEVKPSNSVGLSTVSGLFGVQLIGLFVVAWFLSF